jgi:inosose dehydratase
MGVKHLFLSPQHPGVSREDACQRLRRAGDLAGKYGVTLVLETHPDLGTNGDVHLESMQRINHPHVRVNFDTGNIHFYNENRSAPAELLKIIDYAATVELKDHRGKCGQWNFPALGQGVVDIPGVLRILREHGFSGPITMEIEGIRGVRLSEEQVKKNLADSAAYLRSLGTFQ